MYERVEKSKQSNSRAYTNETAQKQSGSKSTFEFVNNRPEAVT